MTKNQQDTMKTVVTLVGIAAVVAGVAFTAGNYPTRAEFNAVKHDVSQMQLEQVRLGTSMTAIKESQARTEKVQTSIVNKLDRALQRGSDEGN